MMTTRKTSSHQEIESCHIRLRIFNSLGTTSSKWPSSRRNSPSLYFVMGFLCLTAGLEFGETATMNRMDILDYRGKVRARRPERTSVMNFVLTLAVLGLQEGEKR